METKKLPVTNNRNQEAPTKEGREDVRVKMFIQMLDINIDTNMARIYSALHSLKKP